MRQVICQANTGLQLAYHIIYLIHKVQLASLASYFPDGIAVADSIFYQEKEDDEYLFQI